MNNVDSMLIQRNDGPCIVVVGVYHETNSFAPGTTDLYAFESDWVKGEEAFIQRYQGTKTSMGGVIDAAKTLGMKLIPGLYTEATPSGLVTGYACQKIIQEIIGSIPQVCDGIVLILHGAMVCEEYLDVEGELLRQVRNHFGPSLPVGVTLDLHANISQQMVELSDFIVGYDTYPHIDMYDRAFEVVSLLNQFIKGDINPTKVLKRPKMLVPPQTMITTEPGPMKELVDRALKMENDPRILNVTVAGGFPFSDVPDAGMSFLVTTDGDAALADRYAEELSSMAWRNRDRFHFYAVPPEQAVQNACQQENGPVILIEGSDNVGGGSPADATHILKYLIKTPYKSLIVIKDTEAVLLAHRLGVGNEFKGKIGGKTDQWHGSPVEIFGKIRLLFDGAYYNVGQYMNGKYVNVGLTAVIEAKQVTLLLTEKPAVPFDIAHIRSSGIDPEQFHLIVVKSAVAWRAAFGDIANHVIHVDSPGCCSANLKNFDYHYINRPVYPIDEFKL